MKTKKYPGTLTLASGNILSIERGCTTVRLSALPSSQRWRTNTYPLAFYDDLCEAAGEETVLDAYATEGEAGIEQLASIHKVLCREE